SALLNARHEVVPFHGREALLAELGRWCDEGPPVAVQLLHAEGGVGKTRLAIELVRRRREQGWSAGFLAKEVPENWLERLWSLGQPVLVVLDYAESHPGLHSLLSRLLQYAAQQGTAALRRIRFLLLARNDGDWWKSLHQRDTELGTWLGTATVHELPPLAMSAAERAQVFHEAAERFAAKLGKPHRPKATAPGLDDEHFQRVLYVHMAALAAVEGLAFEANTLMDITLDHEERFWDIRAGQALTGLVVQRSLARQLVAAATLRGGLADKEEADAILARLLGHSSSGLADEALLLRLLHWVYQRTGGSPSEFLPALEPDLLGEAMVLRVASAQPFSGEQVPSDWIDRVFPPLPDDSGHALGNGLQVLGRASATRPTVIRPWLERLLSGPLLRTRAPMALDAAKAVGQRTAFSVLGDVLAERLQVEGDVEQARQLQAMEIPFSSVSLGRVSEWVIRTQLNAQPNPQNGQALAERASLVGNLGNTLNALGRWEEALQATEEAVAICRKLAENSPEHYQPDLALAFNNLSIMLKDMGRWEEALEAASEAVAFYRQLTESGADEFLHGLAGSLNNLSNVLTTLGRRQEALKVSLEAVQMRRRLVENNAEDSQFGLASALGNLGSCLKNAGQREEALKASVEAVALFRGLAERNADVVQPELASSLNNLSIMLKELGRHQEALRASTEAVSLHRRLAERNADAFQPSLANSLYNLGSILHDLGRMKDALEVTVESVQLRQLLAKRNALVSTPALAGSFVNLGAMLHGLGRREEALEAAHKGVVLHRELAERNAEAFLPPLAESLNNLGVMLLELGQREAALKIANEAVRLRRMLVQRDAGAFQDGLAGSLLNLGLVLKGLGRHEEALTAIHEALDKSWPHFLSLPDRYRLNTGRMLFQLNAIHEALQRPLPAELQERLATFERLTGA
ncbi:MAG TPA: tetratricopeptide repeat protein, partial [Myxococcus sp.]|nr:tetratricopeptide repeat protein [Myxococcus sp.]